jgi:hypothetical protein
MGSKGRRRSPARRPRASLRELVPSSISNAGRTHGRCRVMNVLWARLAVIDPTGERAIFSGVHANKRPFPIEGTWKRYSLSIASLIPGPSKESWLRAHPYDAR